MTVPTMTHEEYIRSRPYDVLLKERERRDAAGLESSTCECCGDELPQFGPDDFELAYAKLLDAAERERDALRSELALVQKAPALRPGTEGGRGISGFPPRAWKFPLFADVRHVKTGGVYRIVAHGYLEATHVPAYIYGAVQRVPEVAPLDITDVDLDHVWIRVADAMEDGRFVLLGDESAHT